MKTFCLYLTLLAVATGAVAMDAFFDRGMPTKDSHFVVPPPADQALLRQGGDTIADALAITLPYSGTGTTAGYVDNYDEVCPYSGSTSPDVVYTFTPTADANIDADLLGSAYDTKVYLYDAALTLIACNDDFHPDYTSKLENVPVAGGETYFLVIDGYSGASGDYVVEIQSFTECELTIPADAEPEAEPAFFVGYDDCHNAGCQTTLCDGEWVNRFQSLTGDADGDRILHGISGWYIGSDGFGYRDGDEFSVILGEAGTLDIMIDAEAPLYLFHVAPTDCNEAGPVQYVTAGACQPESMTITGSPGEEIWLAAFPTNFDPAEWQDPEGDGVAEFDYVLWLSGLAEDVVAVENHSWSDVKALYD